VDCVRSCYSAEWDLPEVGRVAGYYFWAVPSAVAVPTPHYLGSAAWKNSDRWPWPAVGEVTPARRSWANGSDAPGLPYQVTVTGVVDDFCTGCDAINATWTMVKVPGVCRWDGPLFTWPTGGGSGCVGLKRWRLRLDGAPGSALLLCERVTGPGPTFWADYRNLPGQVWKWFEPNTLVRILGNEGPCLGFPDTLTVVPAVSE